MSKKKLLCMILAISLLASVLVVGCSNESTNTGKEEDVEVSTGQDNEKVDDGKRDETKLDDQEMIDLEKRVLQAAPAEDAAIVDELEGFGTFRNESLTGKYSMPEGLVIRESYIEDGKIHIPPSGLYYTIRLSNYNTNPFGENVLYTLGKKYHWVDFSFKQDVLADATYSKVGDKVQFADGSKSLELTGLSPTSPGFAAPVATFSILKASGNYYGADFKVSTDPKLLDVTTGVLNNGTGRTTGAYLAGHEGKSWAEEYYGSSVAGGGATYLVADEITADKSVVKEFATGSIEYALFTEQEPEKMALGVNEKTQLGDWEVEVLSISDNSAKVKLVNTKTDEELEKELGPLTDETTSRIPADQVQRSQFIIRPESNDVHVQLDLYNDPFGEAEKVKLVGFYDIIKTDNGEAWPLDERFIYRPDTWATCNLFIEVMLENDEPIILDNTNNVFVGPNEYFKIVVEDFDGETVNSWYVEDAEGNKTANLSERAGGKHIDLLLGKGNRTVSFFIDKMKDSLLDELQLKVKELESR